MSRFNDSKYVLEREIRKWPGVTYSIEPSKVHPKLRLRYRESERFLPFSKTRVDPRGMLNKVTQLRRVLRDMGAAQE